MPQWEKPMGLNERPHVSQLGPDATRYLKKKKTEKTKIGFNVELLTSKFLME